MPSSVANEKITYPLIAKPQWVLAFDLDENSVDFFTEAVASEALAVTIHADEDETARGVELLLAEEPNLAEWQQRLNILAEYAGMVAPECRAFPVPEKNWLLEVQRSFTPITAGRFWLHGSHIEEKAPTGLLPLKVDAGLAFGSGEHQTTKGCLIAIDRLVDGLPKGPVLDVGCGSGILAMALAKAGREQVVASDIDPVAVDVSRANAQDNGVTHIQFEVADGLGHPALAASAPYVMVVANILAQPLMALAGDIVGVAAKGAPIVLAGLLVRQAADVAAAYKAQGAVLEDTIAMDDWAILVLRKKA